MTNNRRTFLKLAGMLGLGAALPYTASAQAPVGWHGPTNTRVYRFLFGNYEAILLSDGDTQFPTRQVFAPEATDEQLYGLLKSYFLPIDKAAFHFNVLLFNTGKDLILIDSGVGSGLGGNAGRLLAGLQQAGLTPDQITAVVLTHAHFDHFGGLLTAESKPVFTKAQHFVAAEEWDFWNGKKPDLSGVKAVPDAAAQKTFIEGAQKHFQTLKSQFVKVKAGTKLPDGLALELAPGHTPGHVVVRFQSGTESLLHIADLAHHPLISFAQPDWTFAYDSHPAQARQTRRQIFAGAAAQGTRVIGYHMPFPGLGKIRAAGSGYEWLPEAWAWS
jgi:glyoxylase-like metal-dependent hydrolase (beta-lactamase superfamily II)